MRTKITFFLLLLGTVTVFSQNPDILWQNTIGGDLNDLLTSFEAIADGGSIWAGYTKSDISGNKTENTNGGYDIWIVKTDSSGNIEWQNTIGGSDAESYPSIKQTSDGGYIMAAASLSNISGTKPKIPTDLMIIGL